MSQARGQSDDDWLASSRRGRTPQPPEVRRELYSTSGGRRSGGEFEAAGTSSSPPTHSSRQQHQVQVHRFEPDDDDEEEEDDDESESYSPRGSEYYGTEDDRQDPYNSQPASSYYYATTRQDDEQRPAAEQLAYDSMSTILEVDSEDAASHSYGGGGGADTPASGPTSMSLSERPRGLESPLEVRTTPGPLMQRLRADDDEHHAHYGRADAGSPVGRISPEDKFSGTLSALAAQMARLQRRGNVATGSGEQAGASPTVESSRKSNQQEPSQTTSPAPVDTQKPEVRQEKATAVAQISNQQNSELPPPAREPEEPRKVVEVSHKSTATNIDLRLMDKLVMAYFVERQDKATQSIKFDCDLEDEFDIVDGQLQLAGADGTNNSLSRRLQKQLANMKAKQTSSKSTQHSQPETSQTGVWVRPQKRDASVGTEKFSRERFSLLPQTKTRATQTRPNLSDPDLGISETRRFKLSHLSDLGSMMMKSSRRQPPANEQPIDETSTRMNDDLKTIDSSSATESETSEMHRSKVDDRDKKRSEEEDRRVASSTTCDEDLPEEDDKDDDSLGRETTMTTRESKRKQMNAVSASSQTESAQQSQAVDSLELEAGPSLAADSQKKEANSRQRTTPSPRHKTKNDSRENNKTPQPPTLPAPAPVPEALPATAIITPSQPTAPPQKIPTLKTELRVIIEFADSRRKQRNELKSNSQLIDGKLNKRTEISTSKHVAVGATPRQVRDKLELAGQRHSILYNKDAKKDDNERATNNDDDDSAARPQWHEISKSVVCNEIETDTKSNQRQNSVVDARKTPKREYSDIVMSSDATFRQMPDDKSALELRSRAAQRYASKTVAPDGTSVEDGERLLVESAAAFDESQPHPTGALEGRGGSMLALAAAAAGQSGERAENARDEPRRTWAATPAASSDPRRRPISLLDPQIARIRLRSNTPSQFDLSPTGATGPAAAPPQQGANELPRARYQSSPNLAPSSPAQRPQPPRVVVTPTTSPHRPPSRIEFEEHKEDRRQVTRNGRLVYDDHLREQHRYETHSPSSTGGGRTPTPLSPSGPNRNTPSHQQQQQQRHGSLLKPIRLQTPTRPAHLRPTQASPPALFADQTSSLSQSDDADTMDSGFAQSGVGSSHNLSQLPAVARQASRAAQQQQQRAPGNLHVEQQTKRTDRQTGNVGTPSDARHQASPTTRTNYLADTSELNDAPDERPRRQQQQQRGQVATTAKTASRQQDDSLTFVDDDEEDEEEDELVEQLGGAGKTTQQHQTRLAPSARDNRRAGPDQTNYAPRTKVSQDQERSAHDHSAGSLGPGGGGGFISPPSAFRSTGNLSALATPAATLPKAEMDKSKPAATAAADETELTTRLTRCKFKQVETSRQRRRTLTKLDQILVAPNVASWMEQSQRTQQQKQRPQSKLSAPTGEGQCRFKAQVVFESDTDSAADRHSSAGPAAAAKINRGGGHLSAPQPPDSGNQQQPQRERKQLITETRYSLTNGQPAAAAVTTGGPRIVPRAPLQPNWDYSLRVNRMRGAKVDGKVNTYIKHSRHPPPREHQPLINSLST